MTSAAKHLYNFFPRPLATPALQQTQCGTSVAQGGTNRYVPKTNNTLLPNRTTSPDFKTAELFLIALPLI